MRKETADNLNRYYKDRNGRVVNVIRYDRERERVIFMIDGYEHECGEPLKIFQERYTRLKKVKP
ncbi:DUF4222 domain-containing protein [Morganella psychrotolerans]|uniref:DUF4222 domain-containing protein n=1 Tax=Morganella psychrotolerans TaxID=368603 RepID=UPI0039B12637